MRFKISSDRATTVVFEPTAEEYTLAAGEHLDIEWADNTDDGLVALSGDTIVVGTPSAGPTRAWDEQGTEIYIGPT